MAVHIHTVHVPPDLAPEEAAERAAFVKEGVSWPALFFAVLWLLWHRMWLPLLLYLAFILAVALIDAGLGDTAATVVAVLGQVLFALEANNLRRWTLARRGWREIGESFGRNRAEAEIRFFLSEAPRAGRTDAPQGGWARTVGRRSTPGLSAVPALPRRRAVDEPGLGLFPEPER
ncbi:MAG TPA: DUF2628 domain-containing protein [Afifellaceae bacterium]|nr:DUF2628 domain-containing protein [Afifellaceae bacterium]